eukprot:365305-Chlamydomonas_euryale.AAC.13
MHACGQPASCRGCTCVLARSQGHTFQVMARVLPASGMPWNASRRSACRSTGRAASSRVNCATRGPCPEGAPGVVCVDAGAALPSRLGATTAAVGRRPLSALAQPWLLLLSGATGPSPFEEADRWLIRSSDMSAPAGT